MYLNHFALEDFAKPSEQYIQGRKETNILNFVCSELGPKTEITRHIVSAVRKKDKMNFPTHSHVIWTMECIGYAFSLPIEQHLIISQAIEIYRNWLDLAGEQRPVCIEERESFYQQEIISHFSLLFLEHGGDMHKHAELCKDVLITIKDLSRKKYLSKETWHHLLKIYLLMSSGLLKNNTILAKEIAPLLFKTLFEIWFRSNTREIVLWDELSKHISNWLNNIWVIYHWSSMVSGLTTSVISMVYGTEKSKLKIFFRSLQKPFDIEAEAVSFDANQEQITYFWYNFLMLISKNTLSKYPTDSEICTELVKAFSFLTDEFLIFAQSRNSKGKTSFEYYHSGHSQLSKLIDEFSSIQCRYEDGKCRVPTPRVNSILGVFGNWLFSYANCDLIYCEKGRAKAIAALCRIFSSDLGPVNTEYAGKFYKTIQNSLKIGVNQITIKNILKHSKGLLAANLPGIRILIDKDYLLKAISLQMFDKKSDNKLRGYCYDIILSFACCATYLGKSEVVKILQDLLLDSVQNENDPENFSKAVWIVAGFLGTLQGQTEFVQVVMIALTNRLKNILDEKMYMNLICVISTLPFLIVTQYPLLNNQAGKVVYKICLYIKKKIPKNPVKIITYLLVCVKKWLCCYPLMLCDTNLRQVLLEVLCCTQLQEGLNGISLYLEELIMTKIGLSNPQIKLCPMNEVEMPRGFMGNNFKNPKHFLVFNNTLATMYGKDDKVYVLLRNSIGRSIWKTRIIYSEQNTKKASEFALETITIDKQTIYVNEKTVDFGLTESEAESLKFLSKLQEKQKAYLPSKLERRKKARPKTLRVLQNETPRLLLAHLGLLDYDMLLNITEIDQDTAIKKISELDQFSEKGTYFFSILSLSSSTSNDYMTNDDYYSQEFKYLISQLGVRIDEENKDLGFLSHLQMHLEKYKSLIYFADTAHEVIAIVPSLGYGGLHLQDVVADWSVVVLWNERLEDKFCPFVPSILRTPELEHKDCIIFTPLNERMVRTNFYPKRERPGPLSDNMILPIDLLGKLLLYTVINISENSLENVASHKNRQDLLEQTELISKSEDLVSSRLNSLLDYAFN